MKNLRFNNIVLQLILFCYSDNGFVNQLEELAGRALDTAIYEDIQVFAK